MDSCIPRAVLLNQRHPFFFLCGPARAKLFSGTRLDCPLAERTLGLALVLIRLASLLSVLGSARQTEL